MADAVIKPAPHEFQEYVDEKLGYYCGACGNFHHVKQEAVPVVRGPINARALLHSEVKLNGQHLLTWSIGNQNDKAREHVQTVEFFPWPRRYPMTEAEPLIFKTWELLMSKVQVIMDGSESGVAAGAARAEAKYQARGIAEVLAIQMTPFMESSDHVVKCAVAAYKDPEFQVPGLGAHLWDPMRNPDGSVRTPISSPKTAPRAGVKKAAPRVNNKSTVKLTDKERDGIREAVNSGMFTKEDVASMFKVSMAEIESALA